VAAKLIKASRIPPKEDEEFRYTVAGYIGLQKIWEEIKALREEATKIWQRLEKLDEEQVLLRKEQKLLREETIKIWREIEALRER